MGRIIVILAAIVVYFVSVQIQADYPQTVKSVQNKVDELSFALQGDYRLLYGENLEVPIFDFRNLVQVYKNWERMEAIVSLYQTPDRIILQAGEFAAKLHQLNRFIQIYLDDSSVSRRASHLGKINVSCSQMNQFFSAMPILDQALLKAERVKADVEVDPELRRLLTWQSRILISAEMDSRISRELVEEISEEYLDILIDIEKRLSNQKTRRAVLSGMDSSYNESVEDLHELLDTEELKGIKSQTLPYVEPCFIL
jgi:hypothetical protein